MAVETSFTVDTRVGLTSMLTVNFTDTSTGAPDNFLWDFGDGNFSSDQNPSHTYTASASTFNDESFNVTLTSWIGGGISVGSLPLVTPKIEHREGSDTSNAEAYSKLLIASYSPNWPSGGLQLNLLRNGPSYIYTQDRDTHSLSVPASPSGSGPSVFVIQGKFANTMSIDEGGFSSSIGGSLNVNQGVDVWLPFINTTGFMGSSVEVLFSPNQMALSSPADGFKSGMSAGLRTVEFKTSSESNMDSSTKPSYITLPGGDVDFVGAPRIGYSPLGVTFTDLTTVDVATQTWDFGDGNTLTFAGSTNPPNTYVSIDI